MKSLLPHHYLSDRVQLGPERASQLVALAEQKPRDSLNKLAGFVSLYVTSTCHLKCPHCHAEGDFAGLSQDASTEQLVMIVDKLAQITDRIQLTGGEVFMRIDPESGRNDTLLLIDEIFRRNCETILQTTGMHLRESMLDFCMPRNVRWVSLSLDGPDIESNNRIRGNAYAFIKVIDLLPELKARGFLVKVGTTITSVTKRREELIRLGELMVHHEVDTWKLTQYYGREVGRASKLNEAWLGIPDAEFNDLVQEMQERFGNVIRVVTHSIADFEQSPAVLVQPTGLVTVTQGARDVSVGNILHTTPAKLLLTMQLMNYLTPVATNAAKTY